MADCTPRRADVGRLRLASMLVEPRDWQSSVLRGLPVARPGAERGMGGVGIERRAGSVPGTGARHLAELLPPLRAERRCFPATVRRGAWLRKKTGVVAEATTPRGSHRLSPADGHHQVAEPDDGGPGSLWQGRLPGRLGPRTGARAR